MIIARYVLQLPEIAAARERVMLLSQVVFDAFGMIEDFGSTLFPETATRFLVESDQLGHVVLFLRIRHTLGAGRAPPVRTAASGSCNGRHRRPRRTDPRHPETLTPPTWHSAMTSANPGLALDRGECKVPGPRGRARAQIGSPHGADRC